MTSTNLFGFFTFPLARIFLLRSLSYFIQFKANPLTPSVVSADIIYAWDRKLTRRTSRRAQTFTEPERKSIYQVFLCTVQNCKVPKEGRSCPDDKVQHREVFIFLSEVQGDLSP